MIEIETKHSEKDTSMLQQRINALAILDDLETHGHKVHTLIDSIYRPAGTINGERTENNVVYQRRTIVIQRRNRRLSPIRLKRP